MMSRAAIRGSQRPAFFSNLDSFFEFLRKTTEPLLETNRNARASNPIGEALQRRSSERSRSTQQRR
jgi:hypothetical protein